MNREALEMAKRLSREILAEVLSSPDMRVMDSFAELHDVCDANCIAGTCDPGHYIHGHEYEHEILSEAQDRVHSALTAING